MNNSKITHFRYVCRTCQKTIHQPLSPVIAETPIPTCCKGIRRDMAFQGVVYEGDSLE
ncbi:hypothetical protein C4K22_1875 [Pseudomonas chlororaphis subsp. aurantiaca]|nr:hypothetical protein C4K22_1875 [Pseudomonas chlororaphis subsp. aurantiaca]AZD40963.1 hypothetical protein C4K21_1879 [Pseudomonas chlororaphis subsp. aurantiaca]